MLIAEYFLRMILLMVLVLGPIALIGFAIDNRFKGRPNYIYATAIIRLTLSIIVVVVLAFILIWQMWRHEMAWTDWGRVGFVLLVLPALWKDGRKLHLLTAERRQAQLLAEAEDAKPSEFHYAIEIPK